MLTVEAKDIAENKKADNSCYHCGIKCISDSIAIDNKIFCCEGCKLVYEILNENGLCDYYKLQNHPGLSQVKAIRNDKYTFLDNEDIAAKLYSFTDGNHTTVTFYIPGVHCTSCMWLLEHLRKLNPGINDSRLNFTSKEVTINFLREKISLRKVVELLSAIGYEPYISLDNASGKTKNDGSKKRIYKLGIAGFCFGNIMMLSFPEYLSSNLGIEHRYAQLFRVLNLVLALPVFFYSASEFWSSAWSGLKQKILNIDAPIVLALLITFTRSIYEITTNTGSGYLDSMSGIVFFMLVGRIVQERTYKSISFHRDYRSYFPIAVSVVTEDGMKVKTLDDLKEKDIVELHNEEIIPADSIVISGTARIDYSFVTGEAEPIFINSGKMVYAGGKQIGDKLRVQVVKPVVSSYLTSLWNHYTFSKNKIESNDKKSVIHVMSRYFSLLLFVLAAAVTVFWAISDPAKILPAVSAMLIVACPCALLLAATYTNGNILRLLSNNGLFLRDATVIEQLGKANHIVFDKTGTLTHAGSECTLTGHQLSPAEKVWIYNITSRSTHPYSKALCNYIGRQQEMSIDKWQEHTGKGVTGAIDTNVIKIGTASYCGIVTVLAEDVSVFIRINDNITAVHFNPVLRGDIDKVIAELSGQYNLSLLSGDNDRHRVLFSSLFSEQSMHFRQMPVDKLKYIEDLQKQGSKVLMIGDGLNDAGALQQSNVGITLADDVNNFTPSCDAILNAKKFSDLPRLLKLCSASSRIINFSFFISILYNIIGLSIAMQAKMSPIIAAILMPVSTLTIVLISTAVSTITARRYHLSVKTT
jgi:Cu+-exporting ATPase